MRSHYNNDDATFPGPSGRRGGRSVRTRTPTHDIVTNKMRATLHRRCPDDRDWDTARARYNQIDPHRVFTNGFMDKLLP